MAAFPVSFSGALQMKPHKLRLIGITLAALACWWCRIVKSPLPSPVIGCRPVSAAKFLLPETTRACQSVIYQIVTIQQFVMDQKLSNPMARHGRIGGPGIPNRHFKMRPDRFPPAFFKVFPKSAAENSAQTQTCKHGQNWQGPPGVGRSALNRTATVGLRSHRQIAPVPKTTTTNRSPRTNAGFGNSQIGSVLTPRAMDDEIRREG